MINGKVIAIVVGVLLLLGGAYYYFVQSSDEVALLRAAENMQELRGYTVNLELDAKGFEEEELFADFLLSGKADVNVAEKTLLGNFLFAGNIMSEEITTDISLDGDFVVMEEDWFVRINTIPELLYLFLPENAISQISGNWIQSSKKEAVEGISEEDTEEIVRKAEKLASNFWKKGVLTIEDIERDEVNDQVMNKYTLAIDPELMADFIEEDLLPFAEEMEMETEDVPQELTEEEKEELIEEMRELRENFNFFIWSDGNYFHQIHLEIEAEEEERRIVGDINLVFSNFDEEFVIEAPENYVTLEEVMESLMGPMMLPNFAPETL